MMENKVLVEFFIPETKDRYEAYIPIGETIGKIAELLLKMTREKNGDFSKSGRIKLYNRYSYQQYNDYELIRNTDIRNGTQLVVIS